VESSTFKTLAIPQMKYDIEMSYKPSIPDNMKYWKFFEYDHQIKMFMEFIKEFVKIHVGSDDEEGGEPMAEK